MDKRKTGELIKDARTRKNYTQSELGELLGVTNKAVSRWETGESFPDIGLLESLSNVLDLKIQDIVVGEIQADDETAFTKTALTEIVRMSRLQAKAKQKKIMYFVIGMIITLYSCFIGYAGFHDNGIFDERTGLIYMISLAVTLAMILMIFLYEITFEKDNFSVKNGKVSKYLLIASIFSGVWIILATLSTVVMVGNGIRPFSMDVSSVGPFLEYQLIAVFFLNFLITVTQLYTMGKGMGDIQQGISVSLSVLYLTVLYADALHRLSSTVEESYKMLFFRTLVVLAELLVFVIAASVLKRSGRKA